MSGCKFYWKLNIYPTQVNIFAFNHPTCGYSFLGMIFDTTNFESNVLIDYLILLRVISICYNTDNLGQNPVNSALIPLQR